MWKLSVTYLFINMTFVARNVSALRLVGLFWFFANFGTSFLFILLNEFFRSGNDTNYLFFNLYDVSRISVRDVSCQQRIIIHGSYSIRDSDILRHVVIGQIFLLN